MSNWNKTKVAEERSDEWDRHMIGRDRPIDGGVYVGGGKREVIVVDSEKYSGINSLYEETRREVMNGNPGETLEEDVLDATFAVVQDVFEPSEREVEKFVEIYADSNDLEDPSYSVEEKSDLSDKNYLIRKMSESVNRYEDGKIALTFFKNKGIGICRHQAIASGALIENFIDDGFLQGQVSVDRNLTPHGGHAWVRYEPDNGSVWILDTAQDVKATLEETEDEFWDYKRPDEK